MKKSFLIEDRRRRVGIFVITEHHVRTADADLALSVFVGRIDFDLFSDYRYSDASRLLKFISVARDQRRALGYSVPVKDSDADSVESVDNILVKSGSAAKETAQQAEPAEEVIADDSVSVADLDIEESMRLLGTEKLFLAVLAEYTRTIPEKADRLEKLYRIRKWDDYTIEAHGLKNASRQIGAMELSAMCAELEKAGKTGNEETIMQLHDSMTERLRAYEPVFRKYLAAKNASQEAGT